MICPKAPLKAALIGCGRIGAHTPDHLRLTIPKGWLPLSHAEAIKSNEHLELTALCDIDEDKLSWASAAYGVEKCYSDYKLLILEVRPDILAIATRTAGRCEILEYAAKHGVKGIHAEKPLSNNIAECNKALKAIRENGVKFTYGTTRRFMDVYRKAKEIVASGEVGELVEIAIEHGKTILMWNHPHSVDLLLFFSDCRDVDYIQATCIINPSAISDNMVDDDPVVENAFVKFTNGVNGVITSASGLNTRIAGTSGSLIIAADGSWIEIHKKKNQTSPYHLIVERREVNAAMSGTQRAFNELVSAVKDNTQLSIQPEEICISQNILLGFVLSSLRGGIRLSLPELNDDFTVTGKYGSLYA